MLLSVFCLWWDNAPLTTHCSHDRSSVSSAPLTKLDVAATLTDETPGWYHSGLTCGWPVKTNVVSFPNNVCSLDVHTKLQQWTLLYNINNQNHNKYLLYSHEYSLVVVFRCEYYYCLVLFLSPPPLYSFFEQNRRNFECGEWMIWELQN